MRVVALFMVLVLCAFGVLSGQPHSGLTNECGGVTWEDDPDQVFRLFVLYPDDLPLLAGVLENIEIEHDIVTVQLYQDPGHREGSGFECGVVVARRVCDINIPNDCDDNP